MIDRMTEPRAPRQLRRSQRDGMVGGVASGLAAYFGIDPIIVRIAFVASLFVGGIGLVAYIAGWLLVPDEHGHAALGTDLGVPGFGEEATRVGGIVLIFLAALLVLGEWSWTSEIVIPLLLIVAGTWLLLRPRDESRDDPRGGSNDGGAPPDEVDHPPAAAPTDAPTPGPDPVTPASAPTTATAPPAPPPTPRPARPPVARITYALVFLLAGGAGLAIAAGADVEARTVFVAALGLTGAGLLVGSILGRARGLIPLGLVLLVGTSLTSALELPLEGGVGERRITPASAAAVGAEYRLGVGEMVIDLTEIPPAQFRGDGVEIDASVGIGSLQVVVPDDVEVTGVLDTRLGEVTAFDRVDHGVDAALEVARAGEEGAGVVDVDLRVGVGEVIVE